MGVKDLFQALKARGLSEETIYVDEYRGTCMAVDANNLFHVNIYHGHLSALNQVSDPMIDPPSDFNDSYEPTSYLINKHFRFSETIKSIVEKFIIPVLKAQIFPIFVFDGDVREAKTEVVATRSNQKSNSFAKFFIERDEIRLLTDPIARAKRTSDLTKKLKYCYRISREDIELFKEVLQEFGFEPLTAKYDGEELCCSLVAYGKASLVYSRDGDCLAYGIPALITSVYEAKWGRMKGYTISSSLRALGKFRGDRLMIGGRMRIVFRIIERFGKTGSDGRFVVKLEHLAVHQNGKTLNISAPPGYETHVIVRNSDEYMEMRVGDGDCPPFVIIGLSNEYVTAKLIKIKGTAIFNHDRAINVDVETDVIIDGIRIVCPMNYEMFREYCIMLGTDFNTRMPGIGRVKAYKLLSEYGSIANISRMFPNLPCHLLKYEQTKQIFTLKDPQSCIKSGVYVDELTPPKSEKLINRYRLSSERDKIRQLFENIGSDDTVDNLKELEQYSMMFDDEIQVQSIGQIVNKIAKLSS